MMRLGALAGALGAMLLFQLSDLRADEALLADLERIGVEYVQNPAGAWAELESMREAARTAADRRTWAQWNITAAVVESTIGSLEQSAAKVDLALQAYQALGDSDGVAVALNTRGLIAASRGDYTGAVADYERVLELASGTEESDKHRASALLGLGDAFMVIGDFNRALESLVAAYATYQELGNSESLSETLTLLGNLYAEIDAAEEAISMYQRATELDRESGDNLNTAINLHNIGRAYIDLERWADARRALRESIALTDELGSDLTRGYALYALALCEIGVNDLDLASSYLDQASAAIAGSDDAFQVAMIGFQRGRIALRRNLFDEAIAETEAALAGLDDGGNVKHVINILKTLGDAHVGKREFERAYAYARRRADMMADFASRERARNLAALKVTFETDRFEDEARALAAENLEKQQRIEREQRQKRVVSAGSVVLAIALAGVGFLLLRQRGLQARLQRLADTDDLTGILTRRRLFELCEAECERSTRHSLTFSILALDLDFFKSINDRYGHATGDEVLAHVARVMTGHIREVDFLGRVGGEEFMALLPHTGRDEALALAQRLVRAVREIDLNVVDVDERLTISIGVATFQGAGDRLSQMIRRADAALYQAKSDGRNRACAEWLGQA